MVRRPALWCLIALVFAGDAFALGRGQFGVSSRELTALTSALPAPGLGDDASRAEAPTTTLPIPEAPPSTTLTGPADPPAPPAPPPLPLRPARLDVDFPDPSVVWGGDRFYAFATNGGPRNVQMSTSTDLVHWTEPVDAVPTLPSWSKPGYTWAPDVAKIGDQWVMYVSILGITTGHCIDRLVAPAPGGPYAPVDGGPLVCDQTGGNGAIDPSVFTDSSGTYLYWKADGARSQQLFGVALTPDGMAFAGPPRHLLTATASWQQTGIENPSMVAGGGADWLVYSGAYWATGRYAMGYARCDGPLGPCQEMTGGGPWLATSGNVVGPGAGAVFASPDGVLRLAYHAWSGGPGYGAGGQRLLHIETIAVTGSGPELLDRPPTGAVAPIVIGPDALSVQGVAADPDTADPVAISVFLDGRLAASTGAAPNFGATIAPPADGAHRVCVTADDDVGQSRPVLGCQDITITSVPFGALDSASAVGPTGGASTIAGWVIEPSTAEPIAVDVYVDGHFATRTTADLPRDDVAAAWPAYGPSHGFTATVTLDGRGPHRVCAYGIVADNRPAPQLGCTTL